MRRRVLILMAGSLLGCASLYNQPEDSTGTKAGKIATRVLIGIPTLGFSEVFIASSYFRRKHYTQLRELDGRLANAKEDIESAQTGIELDRAVARYNIAVGDQRVYQASIDAKRRRTAEGFARVHELNIQRERSRAIRDLGRSIEASRRTYCTSQIIGNTVYTNCY